MGFTDKQKDNAPAATEASRGSKANPTAIAYPKPLPVIAPSAMQDLPAWLIWKFEPGEKKPRKVPYYADGGRRQGPQGSAQDRAQLVTFDAALAAAKRRGFEGVGFATLPEFGIVALDFDNCMVDGGVHPEVEKLVSSTYAEYSPSGNGVRAFMRGDLGNHKDSSEPFGFETFSSKGFVTYTGRPLFITELVGNNDTLADVTDDVRDLAAQRFGRTVERESSADPLMAYEPKLGLSASQIKAALAVLDPDMGHDDWLHIGMGIHHETDGEGFEYWNNWSAGGAKYPSEEALQARWETFGNQPGRPVTARTLVKLANAQGAGIKLDMANTADFDAIVADSDSKTLRFQVVPAGEFSRGERPGWIIKGVIPRAELVVLFGASGSGKSFLALDLGMAIARGIPWRGNRTKAGRVVYIAAEGGAGFRNRLLAYGKHHQVDLDALPFGIIYAAPNFLQKDDAMEIAKAIKATGHCGVVVVDTFAQVIPGANENAAEDIGKALAHCRGIHRATGAVVVLVHHAGKDLSAGARGWSGLRAAADAEIEVLRTIGGRVARISKQKDGEDGSAWGFDLEIVPIGMDEDGDVIDSCIVKEAELPTTGRVKLRPLGKWERLVRDVVDEIALGQSEGIEVDFVIAEAIRRADPVEPGKRDTRKQLAKRALDTLCKGDEALYFEENGCLSVLA